MAGRISCRIRFGGLPVVRSASTPSRGAEEADRPRHGETTRGPSRGHVGGCQGDEITLFVQRLHLHRGQAQGKARRGQPRREPQQGEEKLTE